MKKARKRFRTNDLLVDVVTYAFTEWLVRRGIFEVFKLNYERSESPYKDFNDRLHVHVRYLLRNPNFGLSRLVSSAFLFVSAPEGSEFWNNQSTAWERFCSRLKLNL